MNLTIQVTGHITPYDYESIAVSTVAQKLTASKIEPVATIADKDLGKAKLIRISVETNAVRIREDGPDPTASEGHVLNAGDWYYISNLQQMKQFRVIRVSADATLKVTYFR